MRVPSCVRVRLFIDLRTLEMCCVPGREYRTIGFRDAKSMLLGCTRKLLSIHF